MVATSSTSTTARVVRAAIANHHVLANRHFRAMQVGRDWVARQVRSGLLTLAVPGVYVLGHDLGALPRTTCAMVAIERTSAPAALGLQSAVERLGYWDRGPADLTVLSPARDAETLSHLSAACNVHCVRSRTFERGNVVVADGVPAVDAGTTIPRLGRQLTPWQVAHVIWNALYAEAVTLDDLDLRLARMRHEPATAAARQALGMVRDGSCGTKSASEDEVVVLVQRLGLPMPLVNQLGAAGLPGVRLDFVWERERVAFELDGRHHRAMPGIRASDRAVFTALRAEGWITLRAHYSRIWNDPIGLGVALAAALDQTNRCAR